MKELLNNLSVRQILSILTVVLSFLILLVCGIFRNAQLTRLEDQQGAKRWDASGSSAQISCFWEDDVTVDAFFIKNFQIQLEKALKDAAIEEKENARLYVDAYSAQGEITITGNQGTLTADAVGIGGDFFLFHPLKLVKGGYFSGNDLMKDAVILDEEAAWQLFGSSDIEGMSVMIDGVPHYISGVIERKTGRLAKQAGLKETIVYVSYETLSEHGSTEGINTYELIAPNPVKKFAYTTVKEKFGLKEEEMIVVENSSRFSLEALSSVILDFGTRSMQSMNVKYPYWENLARGYEDIMAVILLLQGLFLMVIIVNGVFWMRFGIRQLKTLISEKRRRCV